MGRYIGWDGKEIDEGGQRLFDLRESGYEGWIDQDGHKAACPCCESFSCNRNGFAGSCG